MSSRNICLPALTNENVGKENIGGTGHAEHYLYPQVRQAACHCLISLDYRSLSRHLYLPF